MKPFAKCLIATVGFVCSWLAVPTAEAATPRAYVSVNGNDANTCNVPTTPCRTYTGALTQVTAGGEVIVLDSGTFGGGTISQAVTINAPLGVVALAATPIVVNPGAGNAVVLRGLTFQAATPGTGTAITQQSGALFVENTVVDGWFYGVESQSGAERLFVKDSIFRNNAGAALWVRPASTAIVAIDESFFEGNYSGFHFEGGTGRVSNTVMSRNDHGAGVRNAGSEVTFQGCEVSGNYQTGLSTYTSGVLRVSRSTLTGNSIGLSNESGTLESFGNNVVRGNATNTAGTISAVALQ